MSEHDIERTYEESVHKLEKAVEESKEGKEELEAWGGRDAKWYEGVLLQRKVEREKKEKDAEFVIWTIKENNSAFPHVMKLSL